MIRRIYGIETEFGITFSHNGQRSLSPEDVSRFLFRRVVEWGKSSNVFLENGSRLYLDVGSHPEYATAECDILEDLVAQDKAGEAIVRELVAHAQSDLVAEGAAGDIYLFKNNVDSSGNSYGSHENYCIERIDDLSRLQQAFIPFLATRQLFAGAGKIVEVEGEKRYAMSQRAEHMWDAISSATTRSRPMINTRDEPHADPERFRRLHVIVGDSNMSEFATFLKVGAASIVLAMVEDRSTVLRDFTLVDPIHSLRSVSLDLSGESRLQLANGREVAAIDIQDDLCERAELFASQRQLPKDQLMALRFWREAIDDFRSVVTKLADRVDWVAKLKLIHRDIERSGGDYGAPRAKLIDLMYHDIDLGRGLYYQLVNRGHMRFLVSDEKIRLATSEPPSTTRAAMRGRFVKVAKLNHRDFVVDWVHLKLNDQTQRTVLLKDPFKSTDERFERLLKSMESGNISFN